MHIESMRSFLKVSRRRDLTELSGSTLGCETECSHPLAWVSIKGVYDVALWLALLNEVRQLHSDLDVSCSSFSPSASVRPLSWLRSALWLSMRDEAEERHVGNVQRVSQVVREQATMDVRIEDSKGMIPTFISLDDFFNELERTKKGYVTDTDLWSLVKDKIG